MDKNRKFTVTWNELESLVEGLVAEQLHKYGILNESWDSSEESEESDNFEDELRTLIDLYEDGEIYDDMKIMTIIIDRIYVIINVARLILI